MIPYVDLGGPTHEKKNFFVKFLKIYIFCKPETRSDTSSTFVSSLLHKRSKLTRQLWKFSGEKRKDWLMIQSREGVIIDHDVIVISTLGRFY